MDAMVFLSWMSVLVNGSLTKDFKVGMELRQGDMLSPFLFVIIGKRLAALVRQVVWCNDFSSFSMEGKM